MPGSGRDVRVGHRRITKRRCSPASRRTQPALPGLDTVRGDSAIPAVIWLEIGGQGHHPGAQAAAVRPPGA